MAKGNRNNYSKQSMILPVVDEDTKTAIMETSMTMMSLPDIDMTDPEAVEERLRFYFNLYLTRGLKPPVSGMAQALNGHRRKWLTDLVNGLPTGGMGYMAAVPPDVALVIKRAYNNLELLWENYMTSGQVSPPVGIFLGKNQFGYKDVVENVVVADKKQDRDFSTEEIAARYEPSVQETLPDKQS